MLYHCRMWCYAIGVEAVVLRSWCVVLCTVCQLVASSWYIFFTYIYDARSHLYQIYLYIYICVCECVCVCVCVFENRAVNEIMLKNFVVRDRPQMTVWHMRIACWIPKATNTHSEYVIIIAFPLQQRLHERA